MSLFPKQCDSYSSLNHRHYSSTSLISLRIEPKEDEEDNLFVVQTSRAKWTIIRSSNHFQRLDLLIHTCLVSRDVSHLSSLSSLPSSVVSSLTSQFCRRLNRVLNEEKIIHSLKCLQILNWFECDNNGFRLVDSNEAEVNRRAVGAAFVVRDWRSDDGDVALEMGELVSVLERVECHDQLFLKAKKGSHVALLPSECVQEIEGSECVRHLLRRHRDDRRRHSSRLSSLSSPSITRRYLFPQFLQKLVQKEEQTQEERLPPPPGLIQLNVFGRDLSEQLFESATDIPHVVSTCCEFIERFGAVDGIYRLSGINSNIRRLEALFESGAQVDLTADPNVLADIHCVSSLLKLFFRSLPNPLLTFESFDHFVDVIRDDNRTTERQKTTLDAIRRLCRRLPPPHFRTLRALCTHLKRVSLKSDKTGMNSKNLSIVWAPNLLRARDLHNSLNCFEIIGIQTLLTQFLIEFSDKIFAEKKKIAKKCRKLSEIRTKRESNEELKKSRSFDSFFASNSPKIALNFAKTETKFETIPFVFHFDSNSSLSLTQFTTSMPLERVPVIRTTPTTQNSVVVSVVAVVDDAVVVRHNTRERIERIKEQRRQQLRQQFSKPIPCPRRTPVRSAPVPTPRKSRDCPEIRILLTKKSKN